MSGIISDNVGRSSGLVKAAGGGGKIGQIVQSIMTAPVSTTSATFVTSGLAVAITPVATSSKILIYVNLGSLANKNDSYNTHAIIDGGNCATYIGDAATGIECAIALSEGTSSAGVGQAPCSMMFLDAPSTTSETTYTCHYSNPQGGSGVALINKCNSQDVSGGNAASTIIAMEVLE